MEAVLVCVLGEGEGAQGDAGVLALHGRRTDDGRMARHDDAEGEERKEDVREGRNLTRNGWVGSEAKGTASVDGKHAGQLPDREEEDDGDGSM